MAKSLSEDLRIRVIEAVESGKLSRNAAAERFDVAVATAVRWVRAYRETGARAPRPKGGDRRSHRIEAYREIILAAVDAKVDITLVEITDMLREEHDAPFAASTVWRFLDRHSMTVKKNGARQRAGAARRRRAATRLVRDPA
jgi:transposase